MTTTPRTTVVVVDDHNLFRAGLVELLNSVTEVEVIADGASGIDAITHAHALRPDVVLLDVELPGQTNAAATIRRVIEASERTRVVILTMHDDPSLVQELLEAGASGYLLKTAGRWELLAAVTTARRSDAVLVSVSRATLLTMATTGKSNAVGILSSREVDVMHHLSVGGSNRAIAVAMGLSEATVKRHLANIYNKLDATSRIDALLKARKNGILVTDGDD